MITNREQKKAKAKILIVDDNPDNRLLLSSQLSMHGYQIIEADGGRAGLAQAKEHQPDLILLDVMMPIMNGFEVCKRLKEDAETSFIPIIMVTALRDMEYRIRGIEVGADEFLSRPHHREELLVRVRSLIRLKQARDRLEEERNRLQLLYSVAKATTSSQLDLDQIMSETIAHTQAAVGAAKGSIMLLNGKGEVVHKILIRAGLTPEMTEHVTQSVMSSGLAGWLIKHKRGDIIEDAMVDDRWITLPDDVERVGSVIGVPLIKGDDVIGVLILIHPDKGYFQEEHLQLLSTIAAQVTVAIHNAYLFTEVSEQQHKLETILEQSSDAILTTNEESELAILNKAAEHLFRLRVEEVIGKPIGEVESLSKLVPLFEEAVARPVTQEVAIESGRILFASVTPIPEVGYMAVMQDVTELRRMEQMRLEQERREKQFVKETFSRYMSPRLVEQVLSNEPSLFGRHQRRDAVVMFADLRGFTRMIVGQDPTTSITILNEFFTHMTEIVYEFNGTIFDLAGDELMVGFNVPIDQADASYRAVASAVAMQKSFDALRQEWYGRTRTKLGLGVGIDKGPVIMGNVGAESRMNFAMVGEAVNTAHRLVDIAQDGQIVISDTIYCELNGDKKSHSKLADFQSMGEIALKGKPAPQLIHRANITRTPLNSKDAET